MGKLATRPVLFGIVQCPNAGWEMKNGPQMRTLAISPLPFGGFATLQSGEENQQWPRNEQIGDLILTVSGFANALKWARTPKVADKWAHWLHNPCRLGGGPQPFKVGDKIKSGP